ncbi:hypothetical protein Tco_0830055 [Tanacetum coccineum]
MSSFYLVLYFALVNPSSSHLIDDENVANDEGISRASTPSPSRQLRDEHRNGLRSIGRALKNVLKGRKK